MSMRPAISGAGLTLGLACAVLAVSTPAAAAAEPDLPAGLLTLCLATLPEIRPEHLWSSWSFSPVIVAPLALVALLYRCGLPALPGAALPSRARRSLFTAGIVCLVVALMSPLCRMAAAVAWAHMVQHVLLVAGAPLLLVLSRPGTVLLAGLPSALRRKAEACSRTVASASQPYAYLLVSFVLYGVNIWFWHIPALYQGALLGVGLHLVMYAMLLLVSLLFWHSMLETYRIPGGASGLAAILLFFTFLHTALLGLLLALSPQVWYPLLAQRGVAWGLSPLDDQRLAGLIMWIPMGGTYFTAALAIVARLISLSGRAESSGTSPRRMS